MPLRKLVVNLAGLISAALIFGSPAYLATHWNVIREPSLLVLPIVYFGSTFFLGLWLYANEMAVLAAMNLYGITKRPKFSILRWLLPTQTFVLSKQGTLVCAAVSYIITIYGFALTYLFVRNWDEDAFDKKLESLISAIYFSVVTMATVGYGDIVPKTTTARVFVSIEILVGVAYSIFFFSIIASFVRDGERSAK